MAQQPPRGGPQFSPDRQWWWDGTRWMPASQAPQQPVPPPSRRARRWPWIVGGTVALLFVFSVCVAAIANSSSPKPAANRTQTAAPAPAPPACIDPCANAGGWIVEASNLRYGAKPGNQFQKPEAGNVYVFVDVTFRNQTGSEKHANSAEFVLQDANGIKHAIVFVDACAVWQPVNLTAGATLGPKCLAFQAAANKPNGLTLVWTPGLFSGDHPMKLS